MTGWAELAQGLAEHLATLPDGAILKIIEVLPPSELPRYAQFVQSADLLRCEFISNTWLTGEARLTPAAELLLAEIGWQQPNPDPDYSDNWWLELPWPLASTLYEHVAAMVITGFRDGLGTTDPSNLAYDAWNANAGNRALELPLLGLPRVH